MGNSYLSNILSRCKSLITNVCRELYTEIKLIFHYLKRLDPKGLFESFFIRRKDTFTPRIIILAVDMYIVVVSTFLVQIVKWRLISRFSNDIWLDFLPRLSIITVIYLISFVIFKTYKGIVRYSGFKDSLKTITASIFATIVLIINSNTIEYFTGYATMYGNIFLSLLGLIIASGMILIRAVAKYFYIKFLYKNDHSQTRAIILGISSEAAAIGITLLNEGDNTSFRPVAFLNTNTSKNLDLEISGLPVLKFNPNNIAETFSKYNASALIFDSSNIWFLRNGGIDPFLDAGIKVLQLHSNLTAHKKGDKNISISSNVHEIQIEDLLSRDIIKPNEDDVKRCLSGKTVLVTGAAGSIGSEIVRQLAEIDVKRIILFDNAETPMHNIFIEMKNMESKSEFITVVGDVRNPIRLTEIFKKYTPNVVFHAAAYKHVPMMEMNPGEAVRTNVGGSKDVADLSLEYNVESFVMISTDKAVNPTNVMGASKRLAEIYIQSLATKLRKSGKTNHTRFITTRFGNVLGSNGSVVPLFKKQISNGGPITITDKKIIRYFMTIPEACSLVLEAGCLGKGGEIFVFDMGEPVKIYDLAKRMILLSGLKPYIDIDIVETGLRPGEKLYEELLCDKEATTTTSHDKIMISKARQYDYDEISPKICNLIEIAMTGAPMTIVKDMKELLPEYISNNSIFESIDNK